MDDQDNQQESHTVFHDLGQHLADAYQKFLDAKQEYGQSHPQQSSEDINAGKSPQTSNVEPPIIGQGAQPIGRQEMLQMGIPAQDIGQNVPQNSPTPVQNVPQSTPQPIMQSSQPIPQQPQPDIGAGTAGLPGPLAAQNNLAKEAQNVSQNIQNEYDQGLAKQKELVNNTYQRFQENQKQDQQLMQAYMDKQIDPNAVINNMSNGQKVMTTLGLLFSGIGSGLTGQKNLALEMINNNIARDLEAQKASQGQAYNAYQMHREGTKDEFTADLQHQKDNLLAIDASIEQQKAKLMGPQAVANATATQLGIRNQILDLNQKSAMWNATRDALSNQNQSDPASKIRLMQLTGQLNPGQAEKAFQELDKVHNHATQKQVILDSFDKANQENTIAGRAMHLGAAPASVAAIQNQMMPYLKDAEGRINETEIKRTDQLIPAPGDSPHKIREKRQALENFLEEKSGSSLLRGLGIQHEQGQALKQSQSKTGTSKSGRKIIMNSQGQWEYAE